MNVLEIWRAMREAILFQMSLMKKTPGEGSVKIKKEVRTSVSQTSREVKYSSSKSITNTYKNQYFSCEPLLAPKSIPVFTPRIKAQADILIFLTKVCTHFESLYSVNLFI